MPATLTGASHQTDATDGAAGDLERYRDELIDEALGIIGNREDAEDVVQETFCEALQCYDKVTAADCIGAMLHSINRCNALDRMRRKKRDSQSVIALTLMATTGGFSRLERAEFVRSAIDGLTPKTRAVIILHYFEHLSCREIAAELNFPRGTVNRLLYEGLKLLYQRLEAKMRLRELQR